MLGVWINAAILTTIFPRRCKTPESELWAARIDDGSGISRVDVTENYFSFLHATNVWSDSSINSLISLFFCAARFYSSSGNFFLHFQKNSPLNKFFC